RPAGRGLPGPDRIRPHDAGQCVQPPGDPCPLQRARRQTGRGRSKGEGDMRRTRILQALRLLGTALLAAGWLATGRARADEHPAGTLLPIRLGPESALWLE